MRRPQLVEPHMPGRRKVLVLGNRAGASLIAAQLVEHDFLAELEADWPRPLPLPGDPGDSITLEHLRGALEPYAGQWIHPGLSPWSERPELPNIAQELGITVIGPPIRVLSALGDKLHMLTEAERLGIPTLALALDPLHSLKEVEALLEERAHRFPCVLKSIRYGGHAGLLVARDPEELEARLPLWLEQLRKNVGESIFFVERYLEGARHLVVPFARFSNGDTHFFPMADASLQCRYRKVVEFCPAGGIDPEITDRISEMTRRFAEYMGFVGVGALEFLVDSSRAFLVEALPRLNTGFHLWENVAGTKAVAWQLATLSRSANPEQPPCVPRKEWTYGICLRLYAEDSLLQLPQPGFVHEAIDPERANWELSSARAELSLAVRKGEQVSPESDGTLGYVWIGAESRKQALTLAKGVMNEIWFAGSIQTNERFLSELIDHPWVREGVFHAGFVDEEFLPNVRPPGQLIQTFASVCSLLPHFQKTERSEKAPWRWAVGDQWVKIQPALVKWSAQPVYWEKDGLPGVSGILELWDGRKQRISVYPLKTADPQSEQRWQVRIGDWILPVRYVLCQKRKHRLLSLVTGKVHSVLYREGANVPAHEPLVMIESLHVLIPHAVPSEVRIRKWNIEAEDRIEAGQELAEIELTAKN